MKNLLLFALLTLTQTVVANITCEKLLDRMKLTNSLVCVGLDPDLSKFPQEILDLSLTDEEKVFYFLTKVIDITEKHVCSYKLQKAFYDTFDQGHSLLIDTVNYIKHNYPNIPVFIDCKIGDTENTMHTYMHNLFELINADGVVINPYMGDDVFYSFQNDPTKTAIVMCQTSNPSAKIIQESKLETGELLWEKIVDLTLSRWNLQKNMILILSSNTTDYNFKTLRKQIPNHTPILLAGIGAQGGNLSVLKDLLNHENVGVFINSSRDILYPYPKESAEWKTKILEATIELQTRINQVRHESN